jgi:predicted acetyltransferase
VLATKPEYQGRGAISPIIRHVLAEAKQKNLPVYLEASARGFQVYKHFGWKEFPETIKIPIPSGPDVEIVPMVTALNSD